MNRVHPHSLGLAFGIFLPFWHVVWSLMVLLGVAQKFMNFIFKVHMISPAYKVLAFSWGYALLLIVVTAVIGYAFGWVLGFIWNRYVAK